MTKFHINKHGIPAPCKAKKGNCPLGNEEQHFNNQADAQIYIDKTNEEKYGLMAHSDKNKSTPLNNDNFNLKGDTQEPLNKSIVSQIKKKLTPTQLKRKEKKEFEERLSKVLDKAWNGDQKMIKHCVKNSKYIEMNGSFVDLGDSKPPIKKELWYDDETEAPEVNYETFYNHNASAMPNHYEREANYMFEGRGTLKMIPQYGEDNLNLATLTYDPDPKVPFKEVTEEELKKINEGVNEVRNDFKKRIESYYKRNKDKISVKGYWANR